MYKFKLSSNIKININIYLLAQKNPKNIIEGKTYKQKLNKLLSIFKLLLY